MSQEEFHTPVMLNEVLEYLNVRPGKKYIDATLGGGGHSAAILEKGGCVLGIDVDPEAIDFCRKQLKDSKNLKLIQGNFKDIDEIATKHDFRKVAGILFDLGMSSWQLEKSGRGFSFQKDEPLDMRMDPKLKVTAADLINGLTRRELYDLFTKFGEEKFSRPIANIIVRARGVKPIKTTGDLVRVIEMVYRHRQRRIHPTTKVFQGLRIVVNNELENLRIVLPKAIGLLEPGGRLVVVSFHSLEDRIIKHEFIRHESARIGNESSRIKVLTKRPIIASLGERKQNPRARSAKLRTIERL